MAGSVKNICSGLAIILFIIGLVFVYLTKGFASVFSTNNLWTENYEFARRDAEFEIETFGDLDWTGLKWDITLKAKFPCIEGEEIIKLPQVDADRVIEILDRVHYSILAKKNEIIDANKSESLVKLQKSDFAGTPYSQIEFVKTQFKKGAYLSFKVVGSEKEIGCTLNKLDGLRNYTYKLSSNPHYEKQPHSETGRLNHHKSFYLTTFHETGCDHTTQNNKPMVIRIPRVHAVKAVTSWYSWLTFSYWCGSSDPIEDYCVLYTRSVKEHGHRFVPDAIVSFLFCY